MEAAPFPVVESQAAPPEGAPGQMAPVPVVVPMPMPGAGPSEMPPQQMQMPPQPQPGQTVLAPPPNGMPPGMMAVAPEGMPMGQMPMGEMMGAGDDDDDDDEEEGAAGPAKRKRGGHGRRKIEIEYIEDKIRRHITFSKRKAGISKKAYELSRLTGAQVLLLISSERGQIYSFATPKLQPILVNEGSKALIEQCLNAPDPMAPPPAPMPMVDPSQHPGHYDPSQMQMPPHMAGQMVVPPGYMPAASIPPQGYEQMAAAGLVTMPDGSVAAPPHMQQQQPPYMIGPDGQYVAMLQQQMPPQ